MNYSINNENIYAFSDIHGDLSALIINLRDLAECIEYNNNLKRFNSEYINIHNINKINKFLKKQYEIKYTEYDYIQIYNDNYWKELAKKKLPEDILFDEQQTINYIKNTEKKKYKYDYDPLLGFKWCGGNKVIIITGDLIDNYRGNITIRDKNNNNKIQNEIKHEEIKILLFIKALNINAKKSGGKIINLLGNHEYNNMIDYYYSTNLTSPYSKLEINNYSNVNRVQYFNMSESKNLSHLFKYDKSFAVIFKINNFLFMHGGLNIYIAEQILNCAKQNFNNTENINKINIDYIINFINNEFNITINNQTNNIISSIVTSGLINESLLKDIANKKYTNDIEKKEYMNLIKEFDNSGILFSRLLGSENYMKYYNSNYCDIIKEILIIICNNEDNCINNINIVIGHCPQNHSTQYQLTNSSHTQIILKDNKHIISGNISDPDQFSIKKYNNNKLIYGIATTKCNNNNIGKVYRIDIGMSKSFDFILDEYIQDNKESLITNFLSRCPQLLYINNDNICIYRSTLENTFKNQPRNNLKKYYILFEDDNILNIIKEIDNLK